MNWDNLFTANEISGRVKETYCRLPMILRNSVLSTFVVPSSNLRDCVVERGVETSLAPLMLVFDSNSRMYLCCERNSPA